MDVVLQQYFSTKGEVIFVPTDSESFGGVKSMCLGRAFSSGSSAVRKDLHFLNTEGEVTFKGSLPNNAGLFYSWNF